VFIIQCSHVSKRYESVEGAGNALALDQHTLTNTLSEYVAAASGHNDPFGKTVFPNAQSFDHPVSLWAAQVTPSLHYSMGGLCFSTKGEALKKAQDGGYEHISGLFVAGEVTGGLHGANRLVGNSLLECVVFGRIAGEQAANILHHDRQ